MTDPALFCLEVDTRVLRRVLAIADTVDRPEARVDVSPDGLHLALYRPDHTGAIFLDIGRAALASLEVTRPGPVVLDLPKLADMLKVPRRGTARIRIARVADERYPIRLTVLTDGLSPVVRSCSAVDTEGVPPVELPQLDPKAWAEGVDRDGLAVFLKDAGSRAGHVKLSRMREGIRVAAVDSEGAGTGSEGEVSAGEVSGGGSTVYPADVLGPMVRAVKGAESVSLAWTRDRPLSLTFRYPGISGSCLVAPFLPDASQWSSWWDRPVWWYTWAMRPRVPIEPDWSAAEVDAIPAGPYEAEALRVQMLNDIETAKYAAARAEYERAGASFAPRYDAYQQMRAGVVARWLETHKKPPAEVTIHRQIGYPPRAPYAPHPARILEPWGSGWGPRDVPERRQRRILRGHWGTGASWGPARVPEPVEVTAPSVPPIASMDGPEPGRLPSSLEPAEPAPWEAPEEPAPIAEPEPIPEPVPTAAPTCLQCHGTGILDTRRHSYPCPSCAGAVPIGPTADGCVADGVRHVVLVYGRDAE